MTERVLVVGGVSRSLINFRGPLLARLRECGHEVPVLGRDRSFGAARRGELWH